MQSAIALSEIRDLRAMLAGTVEYWEERCRRLGTDMRQYFPVPKVEQVSPVLPVYCVLTARSSTRLTIHYVTLDGTERNGYRCDCPGWDWNGRHCSHGDETLRYIEDNRVPDTLRVMQAQREYY